MPSPHSSIAHNPTPTKQPHSSHHQDRVSSLVTALVLSKDEPPVDWVEGEWLLSLIVVRVASWILCHAHALFAASEIEYHEEVSTRSGYIAVAFTVHATLVAAAAIRLSRLILGNDK